MKKWVYTITGFFKEGYNYMDGCVEDYAETRSEIEKVRNQMIEDYGDQLEEVIVSKEREELTFSL